MSASALPAKKTEPAECAPNWVSALWICGPQQPRPCPFINWWLANKVVKEKNKKTPALIEAAQRDSWWSSWTNENLYYKGQQGKPLVSLIVSQLLEPPFTRTWDASRWAPMWKSAPPPHQKPLAPATSPGWGPASSCTIDDDVRGVHCAEKTTRLVNKQNIVIHDNCLTTLCALIVLINSAYLAVLWAEPYPKAELCLTLQSELKRSCSPESDALQFIYRV